MHRNEREVGNSTLPWLSDENSNLEKLKREDVFFTSKLAPNASYEATRKSIKQSVEISGLGYIDLFLLHSPHGGKSGRLASWRAVEEAIAGGEVKVGEVSNYGFKHLEELLATKPGVIPAVNQIEVHPFNTRTNITSLCQNNGIVVEAYALLARAPHMKHPAFEEILLHAHTANDQVEPAARFHSTAKSVIKERIEANRQIPHFEIDGADMKTMDGLDECLITDWTRSTQLVLYIALRFSLFPLEHADITSRQLPKEMKAMD